jgi:hypothetical protein
MGASLLLCLTTRLPQGEILVKSTGVNLRDERLTPLPTREESEGRQWLGGRVWKNKLK